MPPAGEFLRIARREMNLREISVFGRNGPLSSHGHKGFVPLLDIEINDIECSH
jgi:hypothetical protein